MLRHATLITILALGCVPSDEPAGTPDLAMPDARRADAVTADAVIPDAAIPDAVVDLGPQPETCFESVFNGRLCYPSCDPSGRCAADQMCQAVRDTQVCVPDCRAVGCPQALVCNPDTGHCAHPADLLQRGAPCDSRDDCADCCVWTQMHGEDFCDPNDWQCIPIEQRPGEQGRCGGIGNCTECTTGGGLWSQDSVNGASSFESTTAACADYQPVTEERCGELGDIECCWRHEVTPLDQGRCYSDPDLCWGGACACLDSIAGYCMP
jgi:hypothetical protein